VYLDKDLVLPAMTSGGAGETCLVVASTDLNRAEIMMTRIREQLGKIPELKDTGRLDVSASAVPLPKDVADQPVAEQVQLVASTVTEMVRSVLGEAQAHSAPN
jgi:hypothetical protein